MTGDGRLELRVLSGPLQTSHATLDRDRPITVGYGLGNDVVLRDPDARGLRLEARLEEGGTVIHLLEGSVALLGNAMTAPAEFILPPYVPLLVGHLAFAIGEAGNERWPEAERLLALARTAEGPEISNGAARRRQILLPVLERLRKSRRTPLAIAGFVIILLLFSLLVRSPPDPAPPSATEVQRLLDTNGYRRLSVSGPPANLVVHGTLGRRAERERLAQILADKGIQTMFDIQTDEELAANVADVFRANGIRATAFPLGGGFVRLAVQNRGSADPRAVRAIALRDVNGLKDIQFDAVPQGLMPARSVDFGARITSWVPGPNGFVATSDGNRYFIGSFLPGGNILASIDENNIATMNQ